MSEEESSAFERYREHVDRPLVRLFREYGVPRWRWMVLGVVANVIAQVASLAPPVVLGAAIDSLFSGNRAYTLPLVPQAWIPVGAEPQFWFSVTLIGGSFLVTAAFTWIYGVVGNEFAHGVMYAVRSDSFEKLLALDMAFFDDKQTGEVMAILDNDAANLERFLDDALMNSLRLVVMVAGIAAVLFKLHPELALVTLVAVPVMVGFTWWFMRAIAPRYRRRQESVADFNTRIENGISGVELAKTTASEPHEVDRVDGAAHDLYRKVMSVLRLSYFYRPGMELLAGVAFTATFLVGGYSLMTGAAPLVLTEPVEVGTFVTFVFMTQRIVAPLAEVSNIVDQTQNAKASAERVFGLSDIPVHLDDPDDAVELTDADGRVEYDDVTFAYDSALMADEDAETVIDGVSIEAEPGETVALVGATGAGKSTLVKLLMRLYDVTDGAVRVDGRDVREYDLTSLRRQVGYVSQDTFLFDGTIAENIRYGQFDADHDAVVEAAKAAEAHEFIRDLPESYDTEVGERGVKLSGGQRQRIALARIFLQDPAMLVLDEATSAVDTETERRIQRALDRLAADRTTFTVAHRLSTVTGADTIVVLEDGQVVERGSHDELLREDGHYARLWRAQVGDVGSVEADGGET
ncbi:ABC transporter ATP-binding protein [Natronoarchaeum mannanilyticum]|uniref:ABC transporter ATP-binding protein n=1 Tax=Natronoarchaeum mannanilyticum TaxID=926360 RepID=A0AAV3T6T3_9EURY